MRLSEHFTTDESACRCGCGLGADPAHVSALLLEDMETIRAIIGRPLIVTSWLRCPPHNTRSRGVPNSAHLRGTAVDLRRFYNSV